MSDGKKKFELRNTAMTKAIVKSLMAVIIAASALTSCSSDEPEESKMSGEEFVSRLEAALNSRQGDMLCAKKAGKTYYTLDIVRHFPFDEFGDCLIYETDGENNSTYTIPDDYGTIHVVESEEAGVHCSMSFDVKGLKKFTLIQCTPEYAENNNSGISSREYYCNHCNKNVEAVWDGEHMACSVCKCRDFKTIVNFREGY